MHRKIAVGIGLVALTLGFTALVFALGSLTLHVSFADDQTEIFEAVRAEALRSKPAKAAACLEGIVNYYPSGTKQEVGSKLDRIVERARQEAIRAVIADLRQKTGSDLGDEPQPWIDAFQSK
jgi:hypothetical protein